MPARNPPDWLTLQTDALGCLAEAVAAVGALYARDPSTDVAEALLAAHKAEDVLANARFRLPVDEL